MRTRRASLFLAGLAILAGCGGSQPPIGAPGAMLRSSAVAQHAAHSKSWMLPEAKSKSLLYVSDAASQVMVLTYPTGKLVGTLTGLSQPLGECSDTAGNVWVTNTSPPELIEYSHGGSNPIATLSDPNGKPFGCSIDPSSGNLAVSNYYPTTIGVYKEARGEPTFYSDQDIEGFLYCSYDGSGNLFATSATLPNTLAELPKGSSMMITLSFSPETSLGSIQWDGHHLAAEDLAGNSHGPTVIDQFQTSGSGATIVSRTTLKEKGNRRLAYDVQYWIQGGSIVGPAHSRFGESSLIDFWKYPSGGNPTRAVHVANGGTLWGTTVSLAPHR